MDNSFCGFHRLVVVFPETTQPVSSYVNFLGWIDLEPNWIIGTLGAILAGWLAESELGLAVYLHVSGRVDQNVQRLLPM